jgi:hypothetical protein
MTNQDHLIDASLLEPGDIGKALGTIDTAIQVD